MSVGKDIDFYSKFSPSPLSMKQFLDFGKRKCVSTHKHSLRL